MLEIKDLSIEYRKNNTNKIALRNISLCLSEGEIIGIVGESGSGKSTIAKSILHLLPETTIKSGKIFFNNQLITDEYVQILRGNKIVYVSQSFYSSLSDRFTIGRQFDFLLQSKTVLQKSERIKLMISLLKKLDFENPENILTKYSFELSGGMIQRVIIAMAISQTPSLLIADEPTSAIDTIAKKNLLRILKNLNKKFNISVIIISHDLSLINSFVDKIYVLYMGKILEIGKASDIYNNPKHPYTELLLNSKPDFKKEELPNKRKHNKGESDCIFFEYCKYCNEECVTQDIPSVKNNGHTYMCFKV